MVKKEAPLRIKILKKEKKRFKIKTMADGGDRVDPDRCPNCVVTWGPSKEDAGDSGGGDGGDGSGGGERSGGEIADEVYHAIIAVLSVAAFFFMVCLALCGRGGREGDEEEGGGVAERRCRRVLGAILWLLNALRNVRG